MPLHPSILCRSVPCASALLLPALLAVAALPACKNKSQEGEEEAAAAQPQTLTDELPQDAAPADRPAYLFDESAKLWGVAPSGDASEVSAFHAEYWCQTDAQAQVIWGLGANGLVAYDLVRESMTPIVEASVAGGAGAAIEHVALRFGESRELGNADGLSTDTALVVSIGKAPTLRGEVVCDGDRAVYCYEDMDSDDPSQWKLTAEAQKSLDAYNKLAFAAAKEGPEAGGSVGASAFLIEVAARVEAAAAHNKSAESKEPAPPTLEIAKDKCEEEPDSCGSLRYLGGGRLWAVVTENSRGDYFHEAEQIYDAKAGEFVDFEEGQRSKTPFEVASGAVLDVSPDRRFALTPSGKLINLESAEVTKTFENMASCGWL